jgi:hypothetical protein
MAGLCRRRGRARSCSPSMTNPRSPATSRSRRSRLRRAGVRTRSARQTVGTEASASRNTTVERAPVTAASRIGIDRLRMALGMIIAARQHSGDGVERLSGDGDADQAANSVTKKSGRTIAQIAPRLAIVAAGSARGPHLKGSLLPPPRSAQFYQSFLRLNVARRVYVKPGLHHCAPAPSAPGACRGRPYGGKRAQLGCRLDVPWPARPRRGERRDPLGPRPECSPGSRGR